MSDWIAYSKEGYLQKAISISKNIGSIDSIRKNLRSVMRSSILLDGKKYTENLEMQYQRIWKEYCRKDASAV